MHLLCVITATRVLACLIVIKPGRLKPLCHLPFRRFFQRRRLALCRLLRPLLLVRRSRSSRYVRERDPFEGFEDDGSADPRSSTGVPAETTFRTEPEEVDMSARLRSDGHGRCSLFPMIVAELPTLSIHVPTLTFLILRLRYSNHPLRMQLGVLLRVRVLFVARRRLRMLRQPLLQLLFDRNFLEPISGSFAGCTDRKR